MQNPLLRIETLTSPAITIQNTQLHLRSQLVQLRLPAINGRVIWNRPVAVVVDTLDGDNKIVPISDMTRILVLTLAGLCFMGLLVVLSFRRRN